MLTDKQSPLGKDTGDVCSDEFTSQLTFEKSEYEVLYSTDEKKCF